MIDADIFDVILRYLNDGYLIHCENKAEAVDILHALKQEGYNLSEYSQGLRLGYMKYDDEYPNVGLNGNWIAWWKDAQTTHRVVSYSDIVNGVMAYGDADDDFEIRLADLLS